jgi:hypothetical protein
VAAVQKANEPLQTRLSRLEERTELQEPRLLNGSPGARLEFDEPEETAGFVKRRRDMD